jgi:hypothetical protein
MANNNIIWVSHCAIYKFINIDDRVKLGGGGGWFICLDIKMKFFEKGSRGTISHMHITKRAWCLFFGIPPSSHCMPPWVSTHFHNSQRLLCIYWSRVVQINPNQKECYCSSLACCAHFNSKYSILFLLRFSLYIKKFFKVYFILVEYTLMISQKCWFIFFMILKVPYLDNSFLEVVKA